MTRLIALLAPRGWPGLILKSLGLTAVIVGFYMGQQWLTQGVPVGGWMQSIADVLVVGLPFVMFLLALVGHLHRLQAQLAVIASTDQLTGLPNRREFFRRATARGLGGTVVMMADLDHFKAINDRYGHAAGDRCLSAVADRLRSLQDRGHLVGRIGGDEFAIVLASLDRETARTVGEGLSRRTLVPGGEGAPDIPVTLSVGAACLRTATSLDQALLRADHGLYRAKADGRAKLHFWEEGQAGREGTVSLSGRITRDGPRRGPATLGD